MLISPVRRLTRKMPASETDDWRRSARNRPAVGAGALAGGIADGDADAAVLQAILAGPHLAGQPGRCDRCGSAPDAARHELILLGGHPRPDKARRELQGARPGAPRPCFLALLSIRRWCHDRAVLRGISLGYRLLNMRLRLSLSNRPYDGACARVRPACFRSRRNAGRHGARSGGRAQCGAAAKGWVRSRWSEARDLIGAGPGR
jgi:hypothetical protein